MTPPPQGAAPPAVAITFEAAGGWCLGWFHPPATPWRDLAVVMCPPIGYEAVCGR